MKKIILIILILVAVAFLFYLYFQAKSVSEQNTNSFLINKNINKKTDNPFIEENAEAINEPLSQSLERVIKKPFGIYITPENSPVSPERFTGYHNGADFEILPGEENIDVEIRAICDGQLIYKNYVSGYGGVAIESCELDSQPVTVLYGHLRLSSITELNSQLTVGQKIGVLGTGFSQETDYERKHLHLAVHLGGEINFLGYVQDFADLNNWVDPLIYLK